MSKKIGDVLVVDGIDLLWTITLIIVGGVLIGVGCFLLSNNNLVGFVMVGAGIVIADQHIGTKTCPQCRTNIHHKATMCKHCHSMQDPEEQ